MKITILEQKCDCGALACGGNFPAEVRIKPESESLEEMMEMLLFIEILKARRNTTIEYETVSGAAQKPEVEFPSYL